MPNYVEIVRLHELNINQRQISRTVGSGRDTVRRIIKIANDQDLHYDQLIELNQTELENVFGSHKNTKERNTNVVIPDYPALAKELAKPGVTMQLLWEEYVDQYKNSDQMYYRLTQFKKYFRDYLSQHSYTNIIHHKAGERVQVDWAGERPPMG